jgi:hypothetical protein
MHWLLILSLLASTTNLTGAPGATMNGLAENALRQQLGGARVVRVNIAPEAGRRGDFRSMQVTLDGFSADRLLGLADRAAASAPQSTPSGSSASGNSAGDRYLRPNQFDLGDILGGNAGVLGDILGGVLGSGVLGAPAQGHIGNLALNATNFTYQGVRYDAMAFNLGEIRFDWSKALRGDFDIQSVRPGTLQLRLSADAAQQLVAPRLPSVRDVKLSFRNGMAMIGGRADFYGLNIPFEAGGRLSVRANEVRADDIQLSVARLRLPPVVVDELTRSVNPLYDFDPQDRWPMQVNLNSADGGNNVLAMQGGLQWIGFNGRQSTPAAAPTPRPAPGDIFGGIFGRR